MENFAFYSDVTTLFSADMSGLSRDIHAHACRVRSRPGQEHRHFIEVISVMESFIYVFLTNLCVMELRDKGPLANFS